MSSFARKTSSHFNDMHDLKHGGKFNDENDEGIFVLESNGEDDDDYDYDYHEPKTEFGKSLSRLEHATRQVGEDTQLLDHELKAIQSKNESTERRILKLMKDAAAFRGRLSGFLGSYTRRERYAGMLPPAEPRLRAAKADDTLSAPPTTPSVHKASINVLLKQNSIEQPIHVNIGIDDNGNHYVI